MQKVAKKALVIGVTAVVLSSGVGAQIASAKSDHSGDSGHERNLSHREMERVKKQTSTDDSVKTTRTLRAHKRSIPGRVTAKGEGTMTIAKGNKEYKVTTTGASFVDRKWKTIASGDVQVGHKVTIKGTVTGTDVVATWVRDVSLPARSTTSETTN